MPNVLPEFDTFRQPLRVHFNFSESDKTAIWGLILIFQFCTYLFLFYEGNENILHDITNDYHSQF